MVDLTTTAAVKAQLHITETTDDTLIDGFVTQASEMFQTETRRQFYATGGSTLTYDILNPQIIGRKLYFQTDVLGVDRIVNGDGSVLTTIDFRLLPLNDSPKYAAELYVGANVYWQQSPSNNWQSAIQVQGTVGYNLTGQVPSDVQYAVTKLAAWMYITRDSNGDVIRFADGSSQIPANAPETVLKVAKNYKRVQIFT